MTMDAVEPAPLPDAFAQAFSSDDVAESPNVESTLKRWPGSDAAG